MAFHAASYQELLTGPVRPVFLALLGCAVACTADCLRERCESAHRPLPGPQAGVRGSGRTGREPRAIDRQLLTEGAVLSVLGCVLGMILARLALMALASFPTARFHVPI